MTGNMANYTGNTNRKTIAPSTAQQTWKIPAGYHDGNGYVTVNAPVAGSTAAIFGSCQLWNGSTVSLNAYPTTKVNVDANGTDGFKIKYAGIYRVLAHLYVGYRSGSTLKLLKGSTELKSVNDSNACAYIEMSVKCASGDILYIRGRGIGLWACVLFEA